MGDVMQEVLRRVCAEGPFEEWRHPERPAESEEPSLIDAAQTVYDGAEQLVEGIPEAAVAEVREQVAGILTGLGPIVERLDREAAENLVKAVEALKR